jgi:hypothetical protein
MLPQGASRTELPSGGRTEVERLYRAIFREAPPSLVAERFQAASALLERAAGAQDLDAYRRALERVGDLEALEVAARHRGKLPLLGAKFRLMVYIAETEPRNQRFFVKRRPSRLACVAAVCLGGVQTGYKLAKGMVLLSRVGHV